MKYEEAYKNQIVPEDDTTIGKYKSKYDVDY